MNFETQKIKTLAGLRIKIEEWMEEV